MISWLPWLMIKFWLEDWIRHCWLGWSKISVWIVNSKKRLSNTCLSENFVNVYSDVYSELCSTFCCICYHGYMEEKISLECTDGTYHLESECNNGYLEGVLKRQVCPWFSRDVYLSIKAKSGLVSWTSALRFYTDTLCVTIQIISVTFKRQNKHKR